MSRIYDLIKSAQHRDKQDTMQKYDKSSMCIKCGSQDITNVHIPRHTNGIYVCTPPAYAQIPEHINRTCQCCGFTWWESPLDSVNPFYSGLFFHPDGTPEDMLKRLGIKYPRKDEQPDTPEGYIRCGDKLYKLSPEWDKQDTPASDDDPGGTIAKSDWDYESKGILDDMKSACDNDHKLDTPAPDNEMEHYYSPDGELMLSFNKNDIIMYTLSESRNPGTAEYRCTFKINTA